MYITYSTEIYANNTQLQTCTSNLTSHVNQPMFSVTTHAQCHAESGGGKARKILSRYYCQVFGTLTEICQSAVFEQLNFSQISHTSQIPGVKIMAT